jgi:hypothetical protein
VRRRGDEDHPVGADRLHPEAPILRRAADQRHVEHVLQRALVEALGGVDLEDDLRLRVARLERVDDPRQQVHAAGGVGAENQLALGCGAELRHDAAGLVLGVQDRDGGAVERLAGLRQAQPRLTADRPLEQRQPALLLERADLQADGRLRQADLGRGGGDAALLRDHVEDPELVEVHRGVRARS